MKEMGVILAQATALGLAVPVGVVGLTEAGKRLSGGSDDAGLYGFILVAAAFAGWWAKKTADRDAIKPSSPPRDSTSPPWTTSRCSSG